MANVIAIPNKDGRIRVRMDYKDLNKESLKDDFSLPHIDVLIDNVTKQMSFIHS